MIFLEVWKHFDHGFLNDMNDLQLKKASPSSHRIDYKLHTLSVVFGRQDIWKLIQLYQKNKINV